MNPHEEKLWRMLEEGKITLEQWEALRANLPGAESQEPKETGAETPPPPPPYPHPAPSPGFQAGTRPWPVAAAALLFFLVSGAGLCVLGLNGIPASICNIAIGIGLLKMKRWVYVLALVLSALAATATLVQSQAVGVVLNSVFVGLLLCAWDFFYPAHPLRNWPAEFERLWTFLPFRYRTCPPRLQALALFLVVCGSSSFLRGMIPHGTLNPAQGVIALLIDLALAYGVLCRKRFVFFILIALIAMAVLGLLTTRLDGLSLILTIIKGALLYLARADFLRPPSHRPAAGYSTPDPE